MACFNVDLDATQIEEIVRLASIIREKIGASEAYIQNVVAWTCYHYCSEYRIIGYRVDIKGFFNDEGIRDWHRKAIKFAYYSIHKENKVLEIVNRVIEEHPSWFTREQERMVRDVSPKFAGETNPGAIVSALVSIYSNATIKEISGVLKTSESIEKCIARVKEIIMEDEKKWIIKPDRNKGD